jgi:phosphotransferase system  glucose/maltose/N-acetylglucosamine-specific IIC component
VAPDTLSQVMAASGSAIFGNLPLLFAIGVAIGLAGNDGVAALAGTVGYVVFLATMGIFAKLLGIGPKTIMGIPSIETGVFGGIVVGLIAAAALNRFYRLNLPSYLGFFAGKRSVVVRDRRKVQEPALRAEGIAALVVVDSQTLHLLAGLNADQYAAEMRGLLAASGQ